VAVEHLLDDADHFVAVPRLLFDQGQQQQLEIAVAEHPAAAAPTSAAAHVVPSTEEAATAVSAETGAGVAFVAGVPGVAAPFGVAAMMHGAEEVVQAHGGFPFVSRVFYDISQECLEQYPGGGFFPRRLRAGTTPFRMKWHARPVATSRMPNAT
jgi:hypothetical protein